MADCLEQNGSLLKHIWKGLKAEAELGFPATGSSVPPSQYKSSHKYTAPRGKKLPVDKSSHNDNIPTNKVGGTQKLGSKLISLSHKRFFDDPTEKRIVDGEITPKSEYYLGWE